MLNVIYRFWRNWRFHHYWKFTDIEIRNAPTLIACTSQYNGTYLTNEGWGTVWYDSDLDGFGDLTDLFPNDSTQWLDQDNDGYGDNAGGTTPDGCDW